MAKRTLCEICARHGGHSSQDAHDGGTDVRPGECCEAVREDVARLRACLTRAWLLLARGCRMRALEAFADLYELTAGVSDKAWAKSCCGAHDIVRSLCHLLDRGECSEHRVLEAVVEHIDALEESARRRSGGSQECGRGALRMRLRRACSRAGVGAPAYLAVQRGEGPSGDTRRAGSRV